MNIEAQVKALGFAEDAKEAFLPKLRAQHQDAIRDVLDKVGPEVAKFAKRIKDEDALRDRLVFGPGLAVNVYTYYELFPSHVRFVTKWRLEENGEHIDYFYRAFNVGAPQTFN